jgi:hypothetical protein
VTLGLSRNNHPIKLQKLLNKADIFLRDLLSLFIFQYFRTEDRVILSPGIMSLDLEIGLTVPGKGMEENGFLNG